MKAVVMFTLTFSYKTKAGLNAYIKISKESGTIQVHVDEVIVT